LHRVYLCALALERGQASTVLTPARRFIIARGKYQNTNTKIQQSLCTFIFQPLKHINGDDISILAPHLRFDEKSRAESRLIESCDVPVKTQQKRVDVFCIRGREIFSPALYLKHVKIIA
jgi:hypothetical protein